MLLEFLQLVLVFIFPAMTSTVYGFEPNLVREMKNVTVPKGKDAVFVCEVHDLGGHKVAWLNVDTKAILAIHDHVITNNNRLAAAHKESNTWTLTIKNVRREDRGYYMCQVNTDPMKSWKVFLEVVVPPDIVSSGTSSETTVVENKSATLECKARGVPKPTVTWRREDGKEITIRGVNNERNKTYIYEGDILYLPKVTRNEMGTYLCIASNGVPPAVSQRVQLTVNFHPIIHVPNQLVGVPLGKLVVLQCISEAHPKPINYWEKVENSENQMVIHDKKKYVIHENVTNEFTFRLTLILSQIRKKDYGTYKCVSKNSIGESEGTIKIHAMDLSTLLEKEPYHIMDTKENEVYGADEESDNDLILRNNKTKKLVQNDTSATFRLNDSKYFVCLVALTLYIFR